MNIFKYDNPFNQIMVKFCHIVFLTILWYLFCIPIVTAGASTAAFYHTIERNIRNDRGYVSSEFWSSFKKNLKQSLLPTILFAAAEIIFYLDYIIMHYLLDKGNTAGNAYILFPILMVLILIYFIWSMICLSRFENSTANIMKNAFILMNRHLGTTIYMIAMIGFAALAVYIIPVTGFVMPAVAGWLISFPVEKVFRKYMKVSDPAVPE